MLVKAEGSAKMKCVWARGVGFQHASVAAIRLCITAAYQTHKNGHGVISLPAMTNAKGNWGLLCMNVEMDSASWKKVV